MNNRIELIFQDNEYTLKINGNEIKKENNIDDAIKGFRNTIKNQNILNSKSFEDIIEDLKDINDSKLVVNSKYFTLEYGEMKYFYRTDKTFYTKEGNMIPLVGRFDLFNFIVHLIKEEKIKDEAEILDFCLDILKNKGNYRVIDEKIVVTSVGFNYGSCIFDFASLKTNKGATIEKMTFNQFKGYVLKVLKG